MERKSIAVLALALVVISLVWLGGCSRESPPNKSIGIANPASVYCENNSGTLEIRTAADGGQVGYCKFSNGKECEEWAFYRGECSK